MEHNQQPVVELLPRIYHHISLAVTNAVKSALEQQKNVKDEKSLSIDEEFLSAEQTAVFLKVKLRTVYVKAEQGELPFCRVGKRKLLFAKADLNNYLASRRVKSHGEISDEVFNYEKGKN
jgi:excisionase family DNA binding protein